IRRRADKRTEDRARHDLAAINGKTGHTVTGILFAQIAKKIAKLHQPPPFGVQSNGVNSDTSTSRLVSGIIPSIGPILGTSRPTTGAAVKPAVRWNEDASVPLGSSSMAIIT